MNGLFSFQNQVTLKYIFLLVVLLFSTLSIVCSGFFRVSVSTALLSKVLRKESELLIAAIKVNLHGITA